MISRSLSRNGVSTRHATDIPPAREIPPSSETADRVAGTRRDPPEVVSLEERDLRPRGIRRVDWQIVALWVFVGACFALFVFAGYVIRAKFLGVPAF